MSRLDQFWNRRIRDLDISEILIILHEDIVLRSEVLDEIGLQYQCLDLGRTRDDLDICDLADHLPLRERELSRLHEVALHSRNETLRFSHVHDLPRLILHLVDSWRFREIFEDFFDVFRSPLIKGVRGIFFLFFFHRKYCIEIEKMSKF